MSNTITGTIYKIIPEESGQGSKGNWKKTTVVIEEKSDKYTNQIAVEFWGDKSDSAQDFVPGKEITIEFNIKSKEYNNRWSSNLTAWKWEVNPF